MFIRILKKDLKRKKSINIILFLFICLATIFVASGLNNVISVVNGTDYYFDKAGIGDYNILTMGGGNSKKGLDEYLDGEAAVKSYKLENVLYGSKYNLLNEKDEITKADGSVIFQSIDESKLSYFNLDNKKITKVDEGHIYVTGNFMKDNNLKKGDKIHIQFESVDMTLIIDGKAKDALLGSGFMGNTRIIMNNNDFKKMCMDETINNYYRGQIAYIQTNDIKRLEKIITDIPNVAFDGGYNLIKNCYVLDMIVAFIILVLSICLIIVSFVVLKFSITFTIEEEFREIGVMKAIGIKNFKIRSIYIVKYLILSLSGAALGFIISIPFGNMLLKSVSDDMVLGNKIGILTNVLGALAVVIIIVSFAFICTGRVKKMSPVDAVRSGQTGERYSKKSLYRIGKSHTSTPMYMAINDVLSSPKRFITIIASFLICTLLVLMIVNTTNTMKSDNLIDFFATKSDLYMTDTSKAMELMTKVDEDNAINEYLSKQAERLQEEDMPANLAVEVQFKYKITANGSSYKITCQQGYNTKMSDYKYLDGYAPENADEIAITKQIARKLGVKIGDTITIDYGNEQRNCIITAYFQTMNQLGELIRLHSDAPTNLRYASSIFSFQINFMDNPSEKEIERRKERIKKLYNNDDVTNCTEYCIESTKSVDTLESVQYMVLIITLIVVVLVTILMERAFIADERSQIALLKAIGFKDSQIIKWHTYRFGIVSLIAVILAGAISIPMTRLCITPIFGMMGAKDIIYNIKPLEIFVLYPVIILLMTFAIAFIVSVYTKTIKCKDTSNIE